MNNQTLFTLIGSYASRSLITDLVFIAACGGPDESVSAEESSALYSYSYNKYAWKKPAKSTSPKHLKDCQALAAFGKQSSKKASIANRVDCKKVLENEASRLARNARSNGTLRTEQIVKTNAVGRTKIQNASVLEQTVAREPQRDALESQWSQTDSVNSCEEYVYQRFHDYFQYRAMARSAQVETTLDGVKAAYAWQNRNSGGIGYRLRRRWRLRSFTGRTFADDQPETPTANALNSFTKYNQMFTCGMSHFQQLDVDPKNEFAAINEYAYQWIKSENPVLADSIMLSTYFHSSSGRTQNAWNYHSMMMKELGDQSSEEMEHYRSLRVEFAQGAERYHEWVMKLMEEGQAAQAFDRFVPNPNTCVEQPADIIERIRTQRRDPCHELQGRRPQHCQDFDRRYPEFEDYANALYENVQKAYANGCYRTGWGANVGYNTCDWAPSQFHDQVLSVMEPLVQRERIACEKNAGNIAGLGRGYQKLVNGRPQHVNVDPRENEVSFARYLTERQEVIDHVVGQVLRERNAGEARTVGAPFTHLEKENFWGNRFAGAGYEMSAQWGLVDEAGRQMTDVAHINPHVQIHFAVPVTLLGQESDVVEADINFNARKQKKIINFELLDEDIVVLNFERDGQDRRSITLNYNVAIEEQKSSDEVELAKVEQQFNIAGVPLEVELGATGEVGLTYGVEMQARSRVNRADLANLVSLTASVDGTIEPYAGLKAYAEGGVSLAGIAGAGVGGELTLLRASLPTEVNLAVRSQRGELVLSAEGSADLKINSLSGRIYGYVEFLFDKYKKTFIRWPGVTTSYPLVAYEGEPLTLGVWTAVCGSIDCINDL